MEYRGFPTADDLRRQQTEGANMPRALVFGLAAGLVAAVIWFAIVAVTHYQIGFVAVLVGWLVGRAVVIGSGERRGRRLQVLAAALTVATMVVAEYLIVRQYVVGYVDRQYGPLASARIPLFLSLEDALDFTLAGIQDDPLQLVFWAIALWAAYRVPRELPVAPAPARVDEAAAPTPPAT